MGIHMATMAIHVAQLCCFAKPSVAKARRTILQSILYIAHTFKGSHSSKAAATAMVEISTRVQVQYYEEKPITIPEDLLRSFQDQK